MNPRVWYSDPALPMMTLPFTTRGAPVIVSALEPSAVDTDHTGLPVAASSAMRRPSIVPTYTLPFQTATPRLATSQHALKPAGPGTLGSNAHSCLPLSAASARTLLQAVVMYMTP